MTVGCRTYQPHTRATTVAKPKAAPAAEAEASDEVPQRDQIRKLFGEGTTRGELAQMFGLKYQQVYAMTKDLQGPAGSGGGGRARVMIEWNGETKPRVDVIRELLTSGKKVGEIAKELGISYQIVFQATKAQREAAAASSEPAADAEGTEAVAEAPADEAGDED